MARGFHHRYNDFQSCVQLVLGESIVYEWPVARGDRDDMRIAWKRERFIASKFRDMFAAQENAEED